MRVSRYVFTAAVLVAAGSCVDQPVSPPARTVPQPRLSVSSGGVSRILYYRQDDVNGTGIYVINSDGTGNTRLTSNAQAGFDPRWSPDATRIAFVSVRDGNAEIYVMNADGSNQTRVTNDPGKDASPSWSPDGNRIAFQSDRDGDVEIYSVNVDGTALTRLTTSAEPDVFADWGPDGRILFVSARPDDQRRSGIYVMNADGSEQTELTQTQVLAPPRWSPDGRTIAFVNVTVLVNTDIYTMNADGSNVSQLTHSPLHEYGVAWSADGLRIAFDANDGVANYVYTMNRDGTAAARITTARGDEFRPDWEPGPSRSSLTGDIVFSTDRDDAINTEIYRIRADGSGLTLVAARPRYRDAEPAWSPDGRKIAFTSNPLPTYPSDIYVMNADGSNQTRLTDAILSSPFGGANFDPAWSPDGAKIVFVSTSAGMVGDPTRLVPDIFLMNADGSNQTRLTFSSAPDIADRHARFSPDGRKIAFASAQSGHPEIFVMNPDGSDPHAITNDALSSTSPTWSPDGQQIAFVRALGVGNAAVFVMNADGTGVRQLTPGGLKLDIMPTWSPDGRSIAYASSPLTTTGRNYDIYAIPVDGSGPPVRITNLGSFTWMPDWHGSTATPPENREPTANAGADMTVYRATATLAHASLDGTSSSDPDGDALAFTWLEGGTQIATGSNPSVDFELGTHNIDLLVSDGRGGEARDGVVITVSNRSPTINAGGPYAGTEGVSLPFAVTAADADQDALSYSWNLGDGTSGTGAAFPGPHTYLDNGNYTASFAVDDGHGGVDRQPVSISIANVAPSVSMVSRSDAVVSGDLFALSNSFSDAGVNDSPWNWSINWGDGTVSTGSASNQSAQFSGEHRYLRSDSYRLEVAVRDKDGGVGSAAAIIRIGRLIVSLNAFPFTTTAAPTVFYNARVPALSQPVIIAVLGTQAVTVVDPVTKKSMVNLASVRLGNVPVATLPFAIAGAPNGIYVAGAEDVNRDGRLDLLLTFQTDKLVQLGNLNPLLSTPQTLTLTGDHADGRQFSGAQQIRVMLVR